jgi:RNase P subunit RPR2
MGSLKDALFKIGIKPAEPVKKQNERETIKKKKMTDEISHQAQRNFCEECDQVRPDVEQYKHRNPTTEAEWICVRCADQLQILDKFRLTAQSDTSIKKMFRREYGETLKISGPQSTSAGNRPKGDYNGNR